MLNRSLVAASCFLLLAGAARAAPPAPGARDAVLRVEAGGPTAFVTALAFSPDGKTLYAGGYDKVVHTWVLDARTNRFVPGSASYRVPIGAGRGGIINAIAVSADGAWLAAAGSGALHGAGGFREPGRVFPRTGGMTREMLEDEGTIWAFNTQTGAVRSLRGHQGAVLGLAFATDDGAGPLLASAGREKAASAEGYGGSVRLWALDRDDGKESVARLAGLPDPVKPAENWVTRPGLAIYPGARPDRALVGIAWEDGRFRLWDVAQDRLSGSQADGPYNNAVAFRPDERRFLGTSMRGSAGHLQTWYIAEDNSPWPHQQRQLDFGAGDYPRAIALLSAAADGKRSHAAVVLRAPAAGEEYSLRLIDLDRFEAVGQRAALWRGTADQPVVAAAPRGRHLAAAGDAEHTIRIFSIDDLLHGKTDALQTLHSEGATMRRVVFVSKGKDRGLLLGETRARADEMVFDFSRAALTTDTKDWKADGPDLTGWDVSKRDTTRGAVYVVMTRDGEAGRIALRPSQQPTAVATLPASPPPTRVPLVAIAFVENGETMLNLYHARTGEQVRQCTGPVNPIRSLAFSGDGRLLAAAADDQTVSVWTLTNLDEVVGRHGLLRGLPVKEDAKGRPAVAELDEWALLPENRARLEEKGVRAGDVIEGLVVEGKPRPTATPHEFYQAVWEVAPPAQKTVTLRVAGRGDVTLAVSQGADERKPLLSLFVTSARDGAPRQWVGWSPVGPYDSSGPAAEKLIGWHTNTGETDKAPVRFALANQFRKDNFKPGILKKLVEHANAGRAIDAWQGDKDAPPPEPEMTLGVRVNGETVDPDKPKHFLMRQTGVALTLALDGFPADKVGSLEWRAMDQQGRLTRAGEGEWSADLSRLPWKRGEHAVRVVLRTAAPQPREYAGEITVSYRPPAPEVTALREHPLTTKGDSAYPVEVKVAPGKGQVVNVTIRQKGKVVHEVKDVDKPRDIRKELELAKGENAIEVVAENQGAPEGADGEAERFRLPLRVTYDVPRPQIVLQNLVLPKGTVRVNDGAVTVLDEPAFRVVGQVEAQAVITGAEWAINDGKREPLAGFDPAGKPRKATIDQELTLKEPGKQEVRFFVRVAGDDKPAEASLTVDYRPQLPIATLTEPGRDQDFFEGESPLQVPVKVALTWPKDRRDARAWLLVNGKEQVAPQAIPWGTKTFEAAATLQHGKNEVEVRLGNEWQKEPLAVKLNLSYLRPPRVVKLEAVKVSDKPPRTEIVATVESAIDRPLESAKVDVWRKPADGLEVTGDAVRKETIPAAKMTSVKGDNVTTWTVRTEVPLDEGENVVTLTPLNKDCAARKPATVTVTYTKPPPPRPVVDFVTPRDDTIVEDSAYEVRFVVKSEGPLTKVELWRGNDAAPLFAATAAELARLRPEQGAFRFEPKLPQVTLNRGANLLRVVTANGDGGEVITPYKTVTYHYRPVLQVRIDGLEVAGEVRRPDGDAPRDGALPFGKVITGKVTLVGHISWDEKHDAAVAAMRHLEVSVSGYHQPPVLLPAAANGVRRRDFRADILLYKKDNVVDVVPGRGDPPIALAAGSRARCEISCAAPIEVRRQLLHLLPIDVEGDREKTIKDALAAVLGDGLNRQDFKVAYCTDGGRLYGPLAGDEAIPEAVYSQLAQIQQALRARARAGALNDIVMVYYRGGLIKKDGAEFLHTSLSWKAKEPRRSTLIPTDRLARFFGENLGAQLVFLDVTGTPAGGPDLRTDLVASRNEPHVAVMRYTWSGDPAAQPADARLLTDLKTAMGTARELEQVRNAVKGGFVEQKGKRQPWPSKLHPEKSWFDDWVPAALEGLPLGAVKAR
jgi:WD40 repeat protein